MVSILSKSQSFVTYFLLPFQDKPRHVPRPPHPLLASVILHPTQVRQEGAVHADPRGRPDGRLRLGAGGAARLRGCCAPVWATGALPFPHLAGLLHILRPGASVLLVQDLLPLPYFIETMANVEQCIACVNSEIITICTFFTCLHKKYILSGIQI